MKKAAAPPFEGANPMPSGQNGGQGHQVPGLFQPEEAKVETKEDRDTNNGGRPFLPSDVVEDRMGEEKHQIREPDVAHPAGPGILRQQSHGRY